MARPAFPPPVQDVVELGRRVSHELLERSRKRITQGARQVLADARDTLDSARNHMQRAAMWRALRRRRRPK
jgi:hypothetical protein